MEEQRIKNDYLALLEYVEKNITLNDLVNNKNEIITAYLESLNQIKKKKTGPKPNDITKIISDYFLKSSDEMFIKTRDPKVIEFKYWNVFYVKKYSDNTLSKIGELCGKIDHAMVIYAIKTINEGIETKRFSQLRPSMRFLEIESEIDRRIEKYFKK